MNRRGFLVCLPASWFAAKKVVTEGIPQGVEPVVVPPISPEVAQVMNGATPLGNGVYRFEVPPIAMTGSTNNIVIYGNVMDGQVSTWNYTRGR